MSRREHSDELPEDAVTLNAAAALLPGSRPGRRLSLKSMYRWVMEGRLRGWRVGRTLLVSKGDVLALARPCRAPVDVEELARVARSRQDQETDRILREAKIRR